MVLYSGYHGIIQWLSWYYSIIVKIFGSKNFGGVVPEICWAAKTLAEYVCSLVFLFLYIEESAQMTAK